jgi:hypothetical protein
LQVLIPMLVSVLGHKYIELSIGISMTVRTTHDQHRKMELTRHVMNTYC